MGFEACHPAVNFIFFAAVLYGSLSFTHPVFLAIGLLSAYAYSARRCGRRAAAGNLLLLPAAAAYALYYSCFHHFGVTVLGKNLIGNSMTLESLVYGAVIGLRAAAACMWLEAMFRVVSTDKVGCLLGGLSPRLALAFAVVLRLLPRVGQEARKISLARRGIGRGVGQGRLSRRAVNVMGIFSGLITGMIFVLAQEAGSMRSRGSSLRGRTAFRIYRFDNRDRGFVIALFGGITLTAMGGILGVCRMWYNPRLVLRPLGGLGRLTALGYLLLCLLPLALELWRQRRFPGAGEKAVRQNILCRSFPK